MSKREKRKIAEADAKSILDGFMLLRASLVEYQDKHGQSKASTNSLHFLETAYLWFKVIRESQQTVQPFSVLPPSGGPN